MSKCYDFDKMFDEKLASFLNEKGKKYTAEEWEDIIPRLYQKFGDTQIKSIGTTPNLYYRSMDPETLVKTLVSHILEGVSVSDFLTKAIEEKGATNLLLPLLDSDSEETVLFVLNLLDADEKVLSKCVELLSHPSDAVKESAVDILSEHADEVKTELLELYYEDPSKDFVLSLLAKTKEKDDIVYEVILDEFLMHLEDIPTYADFLATYGDPRAIPALMEQIERDDITFVEFRELKYAIEALGGEYTVERDFTSDPNYEKIMASGSDVFEKTEE